jgi:pyruvate,water dikinase
MTRYVAWFEDERLAREHVGGKGAVLSELRHAGFEVPDGFCITADAYRYYASAELNDGIAVALAAIDPAQPMSTQEAAERCAELVRAAPLPDDLVTQIREAYRELDARLGMPLAVRSSSIAEDGVATSFAGLHESFLNVRGEDEVLDAVHRCYASLWSERAVGYRTRHESAGDEAMAVVVMGMVPCDTSGIAFTAHPITASLDHVVINASFGLGEAIVSGRVTPDSFVIDKRSFSVLEREIYPKQMAIYPHPEGEGTVEQKLPPDRQRAASLTDEQACAVARLAARVETHYGSPQDIEWGILGSDLYLLQSRPITTLR